MKMSIFAMILVVSFWSLTLNEASVAAEVKSNRCNLARVQLPQDRGAVVRSGPGRQNSAIDRIAGGSTLYVCDETEKWYEIAYGSRTSPCSKVINDGLDVDKARSCRSGWMAKSLVELISG